MSGDPTMAGCTNPLYRVAKLRERQGHLREEIARIEDQIAVMEHEISELMG
jgi:hypothetical protein